MENKYIKKCLYIGDDVSFIFGEINRISHRIPNKTYKLHKKDNLRIVKYRSILYIKFGFYLKIYKR
jgi:hypothetical protein